MKTLRAASFSILLLAAAGCLHRPPPVRLARNTSVAVAIFVDRDLTSTQSADDSVPDELAASLSDSLEQRNLQPRVIPSEALADLQATRDSKQRLQKLSERKSIESPLLLMIETKAVFYELLSGRYKWIVYARLTLAKRGELGAATPLETDVPVFLLYDHERELEALRAASSVIAERAGGLVDGYVRGRPELTAPPTADNQAGEPTPAARAAPPKALYFVLVDRFANGDKSNDADSNLADPNAFHGGDLQGVIDRLDWIQSQGFDAVWLSPVFAMRTKPFFKHGAFHGYWTEDLTRVEPRFGDEPLLRKLSDELHARGMKLILDLVLNHVAMDGQLTREHPEWFHHKGPIVDWNDQAQLETHDVHGLPDLAQEREDVYRYLLQSSLHWIDTVKPDGFRLDAVKHIPVAFWKRFNADLKAHAGNQFWLLGEALDGEPRKLAALLKDAGFDALFDFPLKFAITDVVCKGKSPLQLAALLSLDREYADAGAQLVTLVDNHDLPRIATECGVEKGARAVELMAALRGIPSVQYGTEVGLTGKAEPENRGDMRFTAGSLRDRITDALRQGVPPQRSASTLILAADDTMVRLLSVSSQSAFVTTLWFPSVDEEKQHRFWIGTGPPWFDFALRYHESILASDRIRVDEYRLQEEGSLAGLAKALRNLDPREVAVTLSNPEKVNGQLYLVGAGEALGAWDPARALGPFVPTQSNDGRPMLRTVLRLRSHAVYEFKLIAKRLDGTVVWESGGDRFLFVEGDGAPMRVDLSFRS